QVASDLHLEFLQNYFPDYRIVEPADADVLVLAGDIHQQARAIDAFAAWPVPVLYVAGNHEAYGAHLYGVIAQLRARAAGTNVHFLERDVLVLNGVRFLGCALWTDYALYGDVANAMDYAEATLSDHRVIRVSSGQFLPRHALSNHRRSRAWLA